MGKDQNLLYCSLGMKVQIINFKREIKEAEVTENTTLEQLKVKVQELFNIPMPQQRLLYKGKGLNENAKTMQDYGIINGDLINLMSLPVILLLTCSHLRIAPTLPFPAPFLLYKRRLEWARHQVQLPPAFLHSRLMRVPPL